MKKVLLLFQSVHDLIHIERICREERLPVQVLPVPRDISSECGMVLEIDAFHVDHLMEMTAQAGIKAKIYCNKSETASHEIDRV